jgi:hypothetical protein
MTASCVVLADAPLSYVTSKITMDSKSKPSVAPVANMSLRSREVSWLACLLSSDFRFDTSVAVAWPISSIRVPCSAAFDLISASRPRMLLI